MKNSFNDLKELIDYIQQVYTKVTNEWIADKKQPINLKRSLISDIDADGRIYNEILEYVQMLNKKITDITLQLSFVCSSKVTARVKAQNFGIDVM